MLYFVVISKGSNMLIARLSTKHAKPNGHHYVERGGEIDFMREIKVSDLPGCVICNVFRTHSCD